MPDYEFFDFLVVGDIATEFIIDLRNRSHPNVLGGPLLYAAGGLRCWNDRIAILSHTSSKYRYALDRIKKLYKIDFQGVQFQNDIEDDRQFLGYISPNEVIIENPVAFYSSRKLCFPKDLLGYVKNDPEMQINKKSKYYPEDFPRHYRDVSASLICPTSIATQIQLSTILLNASTKNLVIQSSPQYMNLSNFETMPVLLKDLTAFVTTTDQIQNLFRNRSSGLWEMADQLCSMGCEYIIINDAVNGFYLYDRKTNRRIQSPAYPVECIDPTGVLPSFCGGFLAGYKRNYDAIEALTLGIVSASFTCEGSYPFFGSDAIPGLHQNRLKLVRELVKKI
ncbi:MAG: carbohydrate kinase family protein [Anaerolineaceae bacterium]|nr:carbohydrate kinase family protein [Anaerolineaceae bacterium]